jgi:hypothetical protein
MAVQRVGTGVGGRLGGLPNLYAFQYQVSGGYEGAGFYSNERYFGVVPPVVQDAVPTAIVCSIVFDTAESGADASNYTQVEFRVGTTSTYKIIATLNTTSNPVAGKPVQATIYRHLEPGEGLWVYATRVGTGSVNLNSVQCSFAIDFAGEKII